MPSIPNNLLSVSRGNRTYINDSTRKWIDGVGRKDDELVKPWVLLRHATDSCYIQNRKTKLPAYGNKPVNTRSLMNTTLPCMTVPNILSWSVNETLESEVSTGSFEALNCLLVSERETTLSSSLSDNSHKLNIWANYATNSYFVTDKIEGDHNLTTRTDRYGVHYREANLLYRQFEMQTATLTSTTGFPNPSIPTHDADNDCPDDAFFPKHPQGVGAYYILIEDEIVKVCGKSGSDYYIPPGGRGIAGTTITSHSAGARVRLLGFAPFTGDTVGHGIFTVDEDNPEQAMFRTGNCLTSYEGYGDTARDLTIPYATGTFNAALISWTVGDGVHVDEGDEVAHILIEESVDYYLQAPESGTVEHTLDSGDNFLSGDAIGKLRPDLKHSFRENRNYTFTGYWFIKSCEDSFGEDGVPRVRVELEGPGSLAANQMIDIDTVQRIKNKFGQWKVDGENVFSAAGHTRNIPGDWVDFNAWDPTLQDSYPLQIKTQYAQHKEFYEHMTSTELGLKCAKCRDERKKWLKTHTEDSKNAYALNRQIGRHIYKQSIRVMENEAGPIKTYIRLMLTLAMGAWDHPPQGVEVAQRFTKIPNQLFDNMRNIRTGLIYNGQLDFVLAPSKEHKYWRWDKPGFDDERILSRRKELSAPFESTYDKVPFSQPAKDLADANDAVFWINRRGFPVFMPRGFRLRPSGFGSIDDRVPGKRDVPGEWYLARGGSVSSYSKSIDTTSILTQASVTATTAFDSTFTISCAGTGYLKSGERVMYGGLSGHKQGLALTGGVQHNDTVSMDTQVLGLDWNTKPAGWGIHTREHGKDIQIERKPRLYDGSPPLSKDTGKRRNFATKTVQQTCNWFLERRLIGPLQDPKDEKKYWYLIETDGDYGPLTALAVEKLEDFVGGGPSNGTYNRDTYHRVKNYLDDNKEWLMHDILWYVYNGRTWEEYVAHIVGISVPMKSSKDKKLPELTTKNAIQTPQWVIDDKGMQKETEKWQKQFIQSAVNVGNRKIDMSLDAAIQRSVGVSFADPRIQPGDVVFTDASGEPDLKGMYITSVSRQMDLSSGASYTGTYTGYKHRPLTGGGAKRASNAGFDFLK